MRSKSTSEPGRTCSRPIGTLNGRKERSPRRPIARRGVDTLTGELFDATDGDAARLPRRRPSAFAAADGGATTIRCRWRSSPSAATSSTR